MSENLPPETPSRRLASFTVEGWLNDATRQLSSASIPSARLDAELILAHTIRKPRTWLHGHGSDTLERRTIEIANARLDLRIDRVPVAYIIGHKEFYGRQFKVTTATLIPRPESEALIELLRRAVPSNTRLAVDHPLRLADIGTGSGALGITAKLEFPELDVALTDISRHALRVAEDNASSLHAEVALLLGDLLDAYPFTADIIIANLPYVDPEWERSKETDHEPAGALFADNHGLSLIFKLLAQTKDKLVLGGKLILEADPEQHPAIIKEAALHGLVLSETQEYGILLEKLA